MTQSLDHAEQFFAEIAAALAPIEGPAALVDFNGAGSLPSWFDVSGLAAASIGAACGEIAILAARSGDAPSVRVDRRLASLWFDMSIDPIGWTLPPVWDDIAGLYRASNGWIRLHTNARRHREAALRVLDCDAGKDAVAATVAAWRGADLESAIVDAGGCAAEMRSLEDWAAHPQGVAVAKEPLIYWREHPPEKTAPRKIDPRAPLAGFRVLDLTRVLAGPVATRFLAAFGADVLRIDPPGWEEGVVTPEITLGKRCATLDFRTESGRERFLQLLRGADMLVHGYRPDALEAIGLGADIRRAANPALIETTLSAYGWTGPWARRRGYDSLVQMSCGIADDGMRQAGADKPTPLPVQALDHATGYLMATAALRALRIREATGRILSAKLSLARTAHHLAASRRHDLPGDMIEKGDGDYAFSVEQTDWGPARRLCFPAEFDGFEPQWAMPAHEFHRDAAAWRE